MPNRASLIGLVSFLAAPVLAAAQQLPTLDNPVRRIAEPLDLIDIIVAVVQVLGGPIVVVAIIYAGYKFVSADGDTAKIADARRALTWGLVGAAIVLGAGVIANVVMNTVVPLFQ